MIAPLLEGEDLLRDIEEAGSSLDLLHLWWLGQSGFLIQWKEEHLLFDPYLSDSLTEKYRSTNKPHVRMTRLAVEPTQLDFIDVVTSSHNHTDHLDAETLLPLMKFNPNLVLVIPEANRDFAVGRLGCSRDFPIGLDDGESIEVGSFGITAVPAAHESIDRDELGRCHFLGYIVKCGPHSIYHSGDTVLYPGMVERLRAFQINVAVLPINGSRPERRVAGNLNGIEAAGLARDIGVEVAIPCHFEMFEFNTSSPQEFERECKRLDQGYRVLECGERYSWPS